MRVLEDPGYAEQILRRAYLNIEAANDRDSGLHASDLVFCSRKTWYRLQDEKHKVPKPTPDARKLALWLAGQGHHQILQAVGGQGDRKGKIPVPCQRAVPKPVHHVWANLDFLDETSWQPGLPTEIKTTRKSSKDEPENIPWYVEQIALYTLRWGIVNPDESISAALAILFLSGNYKDDRNPILRYWHLEFSIQELRAWVQEIDTRIHVITDADPVRGPLAPERYAWECGYCEYRSRCPVTKDMGVQKKTGFFTREN